jgi:pilus assembly protein CpaB
MDRQKIVVVFGIALLSAAALTWFLYANTVVPKQEKRTVVLAAAHDLQVGTLLRLSDVRKVALNTADVPKGSVFVSKEAVGRVLLYPMSANEPLTLKKLSGPTTAEGVAALIDAGYRAVSVQITDVSGVSGLIQPGSHVDVLFTRPGSMAEAITSTILQNVKVLAMGHTLAVVPTPVADSKSDTKTTTATTAPATKTTVATLVVTPQDAQKLELAKNEGRISLTLRNPQDTLSADSGGPMTTEALDPVVSARLARARRGRTTNLKGTPNLDDPKVWQELTGEKKLQDEKPKLEKKEPEKPRAVIDVFRGDKHVQEMFK